MLATTFTTAQLISTIFFIAAAIVFLVATVWQATRRKGLIPLGLTLLTCGLLTVFWPG